MEGKRHRKMSEEEDTFHCLRCDKELHLSDIFFEVWLTTTTSRRYGVHADCLEAHHIATKATG
jgi:hypothetical protein